MRTTTQEQQQRTKVLEVLEQNAPSLLTGGESGDVENAVLEYILQILSDEESFGDLQDLQETLEPFLGNNTDAAARIIHQLAPVRPAVDECSRLPSISRSLEQPPTVLDQPVEGEGEIENTSGSDSDFSPPAKEKAAAKRTENKANKKSKRMEALQKKKEKKGSTGKCNKAPPKPESETPIEDNASAWQECLDQGQAWGGRGYGGRGEYAGAVNSVKSNIHLSNVTVSLPNGGELLSHSNMDIQRGHRYGLVGRNGVGKSTLLRRLAQKAVPGMPRDMRILLVQQQVEGSDDKTPLEVLLEADTDRLNLFKEQERLEALLESAEKISETELAETAERLGDVAAELDFFEGAEDKALDILKGLQFTPQMLESPTSNLSGGWRMRLALAQALFVEGCDLLLLDEATNHIDLAGLDWLIQYLTTTQDDNNDRTMILVSHDRCFLDAVCTDIIHLHHQKLEYHPGNFSEFERQRHEKSAREARILDDAERKRTKAEAFVQKQQAVANKKSADPNKQRQAKMIREKKMDRIGNYREDGKRYKTHSLAKLDEKYLRIAQKVEIEVDDPIIKMNFPDPTWPPGIAPGDAIVRLEDFSFAYSQQGPAILRPNTLSLERGSKVALVGKNGAGKSSLMRLLAQEMDPETFSSSGKLWHHPNLRIGHVTQYSVEELEQVFAHQTVVEYAEDRFRDAKASAAVVSKASGNVRQYLGAFGLGGKHALQLIGKLSGGERMRLCFATILAEEPHLLLLDESTNHCDYETLDSMSKALNEYTGTVLMVSHNQGFLSGFCKELWVLEDGHITVNHNDTESFDDLFADYRSSATGGKSSSLATQRQKQATMAKQATRQRAGAKQNTALL